MASNEEITEERVFLAIDFAKRYFKLTDMVYPGGIPAGHFGVIRS